MTAPLTQLVPGMLIPFGGNRAAAVDGALAEAFKPGDRLLVVQSDGALLHVSKAVHDTADLAVSRAHEAFAAMAKVTDQAITDFFEMFALRLEVEAVWDAILVANADDVARARGKGRSTTRLQADDKMRQSMIAGLRQWRDSPIARGAVQERVEHEGWLLEQVTAPLGVVGFVFEGRPNVFADATGVLRTGNTVVFRIGSDALETAKTIVTEALDPALEAAGLPQGAAALVDSADRASGWALFSDQRLALAVARGSGQAVSQLGAVARQAGVPVSLHGTGGAWMVADSAADSARFAAVVEASLDRKVCNTLNVCCIVRSRAAELVPVFLKALHAAGERRGHGARLHVRINDLPLIPGEWRARKVSVLRAQGEVEEFQVTTVSNHELATEWEWEETPEVTLTVVDDIDEAITLFNRYSPQFTASLISQDDDAHKRFFAAVNAPFVGDGFTRWVDGQFALNRPELGLSNWENGRLFARGGVLSGDGVFTVRSRVRQSDPDLRR